MPVRANIAGHMTAMADMKWEIVLRHNAADENVQLIAEVPPKLLKLLGEMLFIDFGSELIPEYMVTVILRPVPDAEELKQRNERQRELNRLSAEAGAKIAKKLKDEGQI